MELVQAMQVIISSQIRTQAKVQCQISNLVTSRQLKKKLVQNIIFENKFKHVCQMHIFFVPLVQYPKSETLPQPKRILMPIKIEAKYY